MNSQLLDFDRLLLLPFALLFLKVAWQLYAPRLRRSQSTPASTLEASLAQELPTLLPGREPEVMPSPTQGGTL